MTGELSKTDGTGPILGTEVASEDGDDFYKKKAITVQDPFNLTKPKPKMIPVPEPIKREIIANPVPKANHKNALAEIES